MPDKKPKRPKLKAITIQFEGQEPVQIDLKKSCCLFWDDKGAEILINYYGGKGDLETALAVQKAWKGEGKAVQGLAAAPAKEGPGILIKEPDCTWKELP